MLEEKRNPSSILWNLEHLKFLEKIKPKSIPLNYDAISQNFDESVYPKILRERESSETCNE